MQEPIGTQPAGTHMPNYNTENSLQATTNTKIHQIDAPLIRLLMLSLSDRRHRFHPDEDCFALSSAQMQSDWGYKYIDKRDYWFELVDKNYSWKKGVTKAWCWKPGKADEVKRFCLDNTDSIPALISKYEATSKPTSVLREQWSARAVDSLFKDFVFKKEEHLLATKLTLSTFTREGDIYWRDVAYHTPNKFTEANLDSREFAILTVGNLPTYVREYLTIQSCVDGLNLSEVDMDTAHQSLAIKAYRDAGGDDANITDILDLVADKKAYRANVAKELGCTAKTAKLILNGLTYGMSLSGEAIKDICLAENLNLTSIEYSETLNNFWSASNYMRRTILSSSEAQPYKHIAENSLQAYAYYLQAKEHSLNLKLRDFFSSAGFQIALSQHDGITVSSDKELTLTLLEEASTVIGLDLTVKTGIGAGLKTQRGGDNSSSSLFKEPHQPILATQTINEEIYFEAEGYQVNGVSLDFNLKEVTDNELEFLKNWQPPQET